MTDSDIERMARAIHKVDSDEIWALASSTQKKFIRKAAKAAREASHLPKQLAAANTKVREQEWRDISEAPKDGTQILAYVPFGGGFITQTHWEVGQIENRNREVVLEYWFVEGGEIDPTHWQPLLTKPTQE